MKRALFFFFMFLLCVSCKEIQKYIPQLSSEEEQEEIWKECDNCNGRGYVTITCSRCDGDGKYYTANYETYNQNCPYCLGTGKAPCTNCGNMGYFICSNCQGAGEALCTVCNGAGCKLFQVNGELISVNCSGCGGDGYAKCYSCFGDGHVECRVCKGAGHLACPHCNGFGSQKTSRQSSGYKTCPECDGRGKFMYECEECEGEGKIKVK